MAEDFSWRDGERLIRFGEGTATPALLSEQGFGGYVLLTTARAAPAVPPVAEAAREVIHVPAGKVDEISAALLPDVPDAPLVALGGGRVVDTAKALAGARHTRCAAIPTTLSGAELTPFHRLPAGVEGAVMVRPALVAADPLLMASQPPAQMAASAMNALAHAMEALYTPLSNPVVDLIALRGAALIAEGVTGGACDAVALGALMAGYASGSTGIAVHHAVCQTIVRTAGTPHAETNAVMLPHLARAMAGRAPTALAAFARAIGDPDGDPAAVARLAARSGHTRLSTLGVEEGQLPEIAAVAAQHPLMGNTPDPPDEAELLELLRAAL